MSEHLEEKTCHQCGGKGYETIDVSVRKWEGDEVIKVWEKTKRECAGCDGYGVLVYYFGSWGTYAPFKPGKKGKLFVDPESRAFWEKRSDGKWYSTIKLVSTHYPGDDE